MEPLLENLITLYATNTTQNLESQSGGELFEQTLNKSFIDLITNPAFINGKEMVRKLKLALESIDRESFDSKEVMTKCLLYIRNLCVTEGAYDADNFKRKMEVFSTLTLKTFGARWTDTQVAYFRDISTIFLNYNFYFLSYTNHYPVTVNDLYKKIYEKVLEPCDYSPEDLIKYNLLAKAFVKKLNRRNLKRGFYDNYSIRQGYDINDTVIGQARQSITLIQLISQGSLEFTQRNWSLDEFDAYQTARGTQSHMLFFLIEQDAIPEIVHPDYEPWERKIHATRYEDFYAITEPGDFDRAIDKLIESITVFNNQMAAAIPD